MGPKSKIIQVHWTAPTINEARELAHQLLQKGLVACVNIIPLVESIYIWEGKISEDKECKVLFKTTQKAFEEVRQIIQENSSYKLPEITFVFLQGDAKYLEWVESNVKS